MKKSVHKTFIYMLVFSMIFSNAAYVSYADTVTFGGSWKLENEHWRYYGSDNKAKSGWIKDKDNWYYLDKESKDMKTGWFQDESGAWYFLSTENGANSGKMLSGWQWIDGKAYFFSNTDNKAAGQMLFATVTPDGYRLNSDGQWIDDNGNAIIDNTKGLSSKAKPDVKVTSRGSDRGSSRGKTSGGGTGRGSSKGGTSGGGTGGGSSSGGSAGGDSGRGSSSGGSSGGDSGGENSGGGTSGAGSLSSDSLNKGLPNTLTEQGGNNKTEEEKKIGDDSSKEADNQSHSTESHDDKSQENKASKSNADTDNGNTQKESDKKEQEQHPVIVSYIALADINVKFVDENPSSYIDVLPRSVTYRLSNRKKVALKIIDWSFDGVPAQDASLIARPTVLLDSSREYLRASLETVDVSLRVNFKKPDDNKGNNDNGESKKDPSKPDQSATLTGYEPFEDITLDYKDKLSSSYKDKLPKKVVYKLSDNSKIELNIDSWSFEQTPNEGLSTRARAIILNIPAEYNNWAEDIEAMPAYINVKFKEVQVSGEEVKLTWDHEGVKRYGSMEYSYRYDEKPVISMENYTKDGSDIKVTAYLIPNKTLTVGEGLSYDAQSKKFSIDTDTILADGFRDSVRVEVKVGEKTFPVYIKYSTDKKAKFEGSYSDERIEYGSVSRKKDTLKEITFTNVDPSEYANIKFTTASGEDLSEAVKLIEDEGKLKIKFIVNKLKPYTLSNVYKQEFVSVVMKLRGLKTANIKLTFAARPSLKLDKDNGYYAKLDPVLTLRNFDEVDENNLKVYYYVGTKAEGNATELVKNSDYHFDSTKKQITIKSLSLLKSSLLAVDKDYVLKVVHEDDEASIGIKYKKDKKLSVAESKKTNPYAKAVLRFSGVDSSDIINNTTVGIYNKTKKIAGTKAITTGASATDFRVEIPYTQVKEFIVNNKLMLTLKIEGIDDLDFEVEYADIDDVGVAVPLEIIKDKHDEDFKNKQDGLTVFYKGGAVYLTSKARSIKEAEWKSMGVNIRKKGAADEDAIELSVNEVIKDLYKTPEEIKGVSLEALYSHSAKLGVVEKDAEGKWPVYTLTFYLDGYKKTEVDIVLSSEYQY